MNTIVENFKLEKSWLDFISEYKNGREPDRSNDKSNEKVPIDTIVSEEDIWPFIISAFYLTFNFPLFILAATSERANEIARELKTLNRNGDINIYPGIGNAIYSTGRNLSDEVIASRFKVFRKIAEYNENEDKPFVIISTVNSIIDLLLKDNIDIREALKIRTGEMKDREELVEDLSGMGYERVNRVFDRGEFAARGDVVDVFDLSMERPVRVDFSEEKINRIVTCDINDWKIVERFQDISIYPNMRQAQSNYFYSNNDGKKVRMVSIVDLFKDKISDFGFIVCDPLEVKLKLKSDIDIIYKAADSRADVKKYDFEKRPFLSDKDYEDFLIKPDLIDKDNFKKYRFGLNLLSSGFDDYGEKVFLLSEIKKQKKVSGNSNIFVENLKKDISKGKIPVILINSAGRIKRLTNIFLQNNISFKNHSSIADIMYKDLEPGVVHIFNAGLYTGYESNEFSVYGELDIYDQLNIAEKESVAISAAPAIDFQPGDFIVHRTHGIGKYRSIVSEKTNGNKTEFFLIEYANKDLLFVPTWQSDRIHRYIGDKSPVVTSLNSKQWDTLKRKVRNSVHRVAVDLAKLYAQRNTSTGFAFKVDDLWQKEMEDLFPFSETGDQQKAITFVKELMQQEKPMDLLVCGDVGFGKTEVAIRAAFKAIVNDKQVLMLVPTTILADQHFRTFSERYSNFPVNIEVISRFKTKKDQKKILENFSANKIDLLIGTHRLLSEDVKPNDLGLVVVDEEQRFGVNAKERIKLLKNEVDVLTLTATPIPRTLYMSLTGIRDIVLIETHPSGRFPIETFVGEKDDFVIKTAILREIRRGGQIYYVYNRIREIHEKKKRLQSLLPGVSIGLTHGRMEGKKIEDVMKDFLDKKINILLTTTIIESGMDISNVNTLIVEDSHRFGLSQLYQIRGRVGRSSEKAYAYFFYPHRKNLSLAAFQRLKTLAEYTELGSGYDIAMRDLQIRGAGEILGARQHGHINNVGFDLYCQIIKEEVERLKGMPVGEEINIQIDLPVSAYIPKNYIHNERERISTYRLLADLKDEMEIKNVIESLENRYGDIPDVMINLINIARIKLLAKKARIEKVLFVRKRGIMLKKITLSSSGEGLLKNKNYFFKYTERTKTILLEYRERQQILNLVIEFLNDIITLI